ncbi:MAG: biliverdin-producing heme oxygenase [Rhizobacter sp.]
MTTAPRVPETLTALRQATAPAHEAIDRQLQLDADMGLARYVRILQGFEAFLAAWEPDVAAVLPPEQRAWFSARSRLAFVRRDLAALAPGDGAVPAPVLPPLPNRSAAFGAMYVLEGSALGGQVIARRVAERFGFDAERGAAYFHGFGDRTGGLWREFRERLEAEVDPVARADACAAAVGTFEALRHHFETVLRDEAVA